MATEYRNPFLYGFSPWPFEDEDVTTTGTAVDPYTDFYAGVSEPPMGRDPFIAPMTYEGRTIEDPVETYAGNIAPFTDTIENVVSAGADTTIEPLIGLSDPASLQSTNLRNLINQSRTTIPMTLAGANLTGSLVPQNIEALPPVYDAEQAWLEDMGLVGPYEKMSEFASGFTTDEDEDELKKSGLKKFFAQFKKGVGTFAERTREALKKTRDVVAPNFGLNREELKEQGYTDSQVDFMMMNALGKQAVDEGLFVSGFDYKNTSSGVQDEFNYNVYASNYQEPGSASYERWKNIAGSKAYKHANPVASQIGTSISPAAAGETGDREGITTQTVTAPVRISGTPSAPSPHEQGQRDEGSRYQRPGGGGYGPWSRAKGGLIRKKYGNGGIVDLL